MPSLRRLPLRVLLFAVARPRATLAIAGALCAACVVLAYFRLPISTDQNKLFSRDVPFFRDYLAFVEKFPENDQAYALIEPADPAAPPPPAARWTALADAIVARLKTMPTVVRHVHARVPPEALGDQGLLFEDPTAVPARTAEATRSLWMMQRVAEPPSAQDRLLGLGDAPVERMFNGLRLGVRWVPGSANPAVEAAPFAGAVAASLDRALADPAAPLTPGRGLPDLNALGAESPRDLGYYYLPDQTDPSRRVMLVSIEPAQDLSSLTGLSESVEAIRGAIRAEAAAFPEFRVSLTGRPALEADEMSTTDVDQRKAETVAMTAIFLGLLAFLRSLRLALSAVVCLAVAIGLTFGWATLSVGELNLLSLVFLIALIGIGMDYFVQLLSRYRVERARRGSRRAVWVAVYRQVAVAVTTTCLGAAGAFLTSLFTHFQGAADLGMIAGGGLLLCLICGFTVLPALLTVTERRRRVRDDEPRPSGSGRPAEPGVVHARTVPRRRFRSAQDTPSLRSGVRSLTVAARKHARLIAPAVWLLALAVLVPSALRTRFDPGLLNLQAPDLESVRTVRKLQTWSAVVLSKDLAALRRARAAVEGSPEVASTESALSAHDNAEWLAKNATAIRQIKWTAPPELKPADVARLPAALRDLAALMRSAPSGNSAERQSLNASAAALAAAADRIATEIAAGRGEAVAARLSAWQSAFVGQLKSSLAVFAPAGVDMARVPAELRTHLVSADGTYALYIYPKRDLWQREHLAAFVTDVEAKLAAAGAVPPATGIAVNIYHSTRRVQESFLYATGYALGLIVLLVLIDLRRIGDTLLAVSVLGLGLPMLLGVMGALGVAWNLANFFGLPILIGAGHEYGVFMVHRYREAAKDPARRGWGGWDASDWALLLCAYVTATAFGFFWLFARHKGLESLGLVMAVGITCIYLAAVAVLRPVLKWRLARHPIGGGP